MKRTVLLVAAGLLLATSLASAGLQDGLVADYPLNGDAKDVSGHNRHGTVHGPIPTGDQSGNPQGAYQFDGVDDYIHFGGVLPDMNDMTVSMWVRCDPGGSGTSIFVDGDGAAGNDVLFGVNADNQVALVSNKPGGRLDVQVTVAPPLSGPWRHVVWILTDVWTSVYVDGVECLVLEKGGPNKGFHDLVLGAQESPAGHFGGRGFWKGALASLAIYDRVLSDAEIVALYDRDKPIDLARGLVAYYPLAGNAEDQSGHQRHGTIKGATLTEDQHGVADQAYEFDGVNDCIYFGPVLPDMDEMTLYMWIHSYYSDSMRNWSTLFCDGDWVPANDVTFAIHKVGSVHWIRPRADKRGFRLDELITVHDALSNRWICVAWVMTGSYSSVYVNGRNPFTVTKGGSNRGNHNFILGTEEHPKGTLGWNGWWKGKISCVRLYDRPLAEAEIAALYGQDRPAGAARDVTEGLVAHYPMEEGAGRMLLDASGSGHHGTIKIPATRQSDATIHWIDGLPGFGKALALPGTQRQYVDAGTWNPSASTGQLTVSFWMRWNGPTGQSQGIVAKQSDATNICWQVVIEAGDSRLSLARYGFRAYLVAHVPPAGQWHHVAFTFDGKFATLYVNGAAHGYGAFSLGSRPDAPLVIGATQPEGIQLYAGDLDDLRIYDRVLTPEEVWLLQRAD